MSTTKLPPPSVSPRMQGHIFVSYSSKDRAFVDQLADELRKRGYVVWVDFEGIHGGDRWKQSIADGLHASLLVLLVLTPESVVSPWVEEEIRTALELDKTIIPVLLRPVPDDIEGPSIAEVYREVHYRDFTGGFHSPFEQLLGDLPPPEVGVPGHCQKIVAELAARPWGLDHYIQEEAKMLPVNASPYEDGIVRGESRRLLMWLREQKRLIVLGEPGIGKTVALERLAWELASHDPPTLPVLIKLLEYDGRDLLEWVRLNLISRGEIKLSNIDATREFLNSTPYDCYVLLDGLNEVPPAHRGEIVSQISRLGMEFPNFTLIVTSRVQDDSWRRLQQGSAVQDTVLIQAITPQQIETYLYSHLGDAEGATLWGQLANDQLMRELATTPLLLWLIKEAWLEARRQRASDHIRMPDNRGELYRNFIARMLKRDDARQLNRDVPERARLAALEKLALHLHEAQKLTIQEEDALDIVGDARLLDALRANGLLVGEGQLRFAPHQTVQEHFAARALLPEVEAKAQAKGLGRLFRVTFKVGRGVLEHADEPWWAETFIQLAGLTDDPNALAITLAESNPWLAWWCVQEGRQVDEATKAAIEARSTALINSANVRDRRGAAQALAQLKSPRTLEPLAILAGDEDEEVGNTAGQAVLQFGELAGHPLAKSLHDSQMTPKARARVGILLSEVGDPRPGVGVGSDGLPDIDWVQIPGGEFIYGKGDSQQTLKLDTFSISRYPITYAQFQTFLDDPAGIADDRWWKGLAEEYKTPDEQAFKFANHPRENVNWYQAMAFCRWFSWRLGGIYELDRVMEWAVRLPTEQEWEKAARGTDGRVYPWGDDWDATKCNNSVDRGQRIGQTSAVGIFPDEALPYGLLDMSGNVWEWCLTDYGLGETGNLSNTNSRVVRGGSWRSFDSENFRAAYRDGSNPYSRLNNDGFRVSRSY